MRLLKLAISNDTVPLRGGEPVAAVFVAERFCVKEGQNQLGLEEQDGSELKLVEKNRPFEPVSMTPE